MIINFKLFEEKEQNWKLTLNISKIWKDSLYENANELLTFNESYINFLTKQKDLIVKQTSQEAWKKLQELITRLTENKDKLEESSAVWEDIYDWADGNLVKIKAESESDNKLKTDF